MVSISPNHLFNAIGYALVSSDLSGGIDERLALIDPGWPESVIS